MPSALTLAAGASAATLALGLWLGVEWQQGRDATQLKEAQEQLRHLSKQADEKGIEHAETLEKLNTLESQKRLRLAALTTGRKCLSAGAVRLLNSPDLGVPAAAGEPASQAEAFATDRDVGDALAICRSEHAKLADQLNKILDITDTR